MSEEKKPSDNNLKTVYPKYAICLSPSSISVEAPTKKECLDLFKQVQKTAVNSKPTKMLEDAIR